MYLSFQCGIFDEKNVALFSHRIILRFNLNITDTMIDEAPSPKEITYNAVHSETK